jgi:hypothetical protein
VVCMERKQLSEYFFRSCCKLGQNIGWEWWGYWPNDGW